MHDIYRCVFCCTYQAELAQKELSIQQHHILTSLPPESSFVEGHSFDNRPHGYMLNELEFVRRQDWIKGHTVQQTLGHGADHIVCLFKDM